MLEQLRIQDRLIIALHALASTIDGLTDERHLTTDPACVHARPTRIGSRLDRLSRGHGCSPCMQDRAWGTGLITTTAVTIEIPDEYMSPRHAEVGTERSCRICGCTDLDCSGCIERTGRPCAWVPGRRDLCTACVSTMAKPPTVGPSGGAGDSGASED